MPQIDKMYKKIEGIDNCVGAYSKASFLIRQIVDFLLLPVVYKREIMLFNTVPIYGITLYATDSLPKLEKIRDELAFIGNQNEKLIGAWVVDTQRLKNEKIAGINIPGMELSYSYHFTTTEKEPGVFVLRNTTVAHHEEWMELFERDPSSFEIRNVYVTVPKK